MEARRGEGCWEKGNRGFAGRRLPGKMVAAAAAAAASVAVGTETMTPRMVRWCLSIGEVGKNQKCAVCGGDDRLGDCGRMLE